MQSRRILITGGAGFIGTHLAERLSQNSEVVLFDNGRRDSLSLAPQLQKHPNVTVRTGDTLDPTSVAKAFDGEIDVVIHLAAIAGVSSYYNEPVKTLQVNILGTLNVLNEAARRNIKHFVHFSTSEIFGANALGVDEDQPCGIGASTDRRWVYATSKLASEHLCLRYAETYGFRGTVVRPFNIYGPRQTGEGAISNFCRAVAEGQPITVYGDGNAIRAWCYVSDLVDAVYRILNNGEASATVFNIGNAREIETTLGLARRIARLDPDTKIQFKKVERTEVRARVPVVERARAVLGFEAEVDLDRGLRLTLDWFKQTRNGGRCE
jgi:nucleoside-diphosphate-sugar epimerase